VCTEAEAVVRAVVADFFLVRWHVALGLVLQVLLYGLRIVVESGLGNVLENAYKTETNMRDQ
jgi:hypothetical protein